MNADDLAAALPLPLTVPPGVRWLAAACRQDQSPLDPPPVGWHEIELLARRHRVESLLAAGLQGRGIEPPEAVARRLRDEGQRIAAQNLNAAVESRRLHDAFDAASVPLLFLKGLTLSQLAYGNAMLKMSRDLDLLVPPGQIGAAGAVLERLGYRRQPGASAADLARWHRWSKESGWLGPTGLLIELHSRMTDNARLLRGIDLSQDRQDLAIAPGIALPTLADEALLAYLAVHGASSAWFRLKWLADVQALLAGRSQEELARLDSAMRERGAGRAGGLMLLLLARMYDLPLDPAQTHRLRADRSLRWLERAALRQLSAIEEPTERRGGTVGIHASQLLIGDGAAFPLREGARRLGEIAFRRFSAT